MARGQRLGVCVVGSGTRFLSGISYYTHELAVALSRAHQVSVILMRKLLPPRFYPGGERVGTPLTAHEYPANVDVLDGVDWYWVPSIGRAVAFLRRQRPNVVVLQWWSGTVLHSYVLLSLAARLVGARIVIEFHEVLDTAEQRLPLARAYARPMAAALVKLADGFVVHSAYDREAIARRYGLRHQPIAVIPVVMTAHGLPPADGRDERLASGDPLNLLFFGTIRPYKGLEDLIRAFDALPDDEVEGYRLTVAGETWEGWGLPAELIARSRHGARITFINRYVSDEEVRSLFASADAVVLPYHRSSASGPLHVAMSAGLPVVVTHVGGLKEAAAEYEGAIFVPPHDAGAIQDAIRGLPDLRGRRFANPHSWDRTVDRYSALMWEVLQRRRERSPRLDPNSENPPQSGLASAEAHVIEPDCPHVPR